MTSVWPCVTSAVRNTSGMIKRNEEKGVEGREGANGLQFCGLQHLRIERCVCIHSQLHCSSVISCDPIPDWSTVTDWVSATLVPPLPTTALYCSKLARRFSPIIRSSKYHWIFTCITTVISCGIGFYCIILYLTFYVYNLIFIHGVESYMAA